MLLFGNPESAGILARHGATEQTAPARLCRPYAPHARTALIAYAAAPRFAADRLRSITAAEAGMADLVYVSLIVAAFAGLAGFVRLCERL